MNKHSKDTLLQSAQDNGYDNLSQNNSRLIRSVDEHEKKKSLVIILSPKYFFQQ